MSLNRFGRIFTFTSWGESHGPSIGAVIDGCPPGLELSEELIQLRLDRRRPGRSRHASQRRESDRVRICSGLFEGRTTGTPISLVIENEDARPKDYDPGVFRPGHADFTYDRKYGHRDWRGGGRASARETAMRVAAGAIARLVIPEVVVRASLVEMGGDPIDPDLFDPGEVEANPFFCGDADAAGRWARRLDAARKSGNSLGGVVECVAEGVPPGWGAPVYAKLDAELAGAMMSINAAKGVEIGDGFAAARADGLSNADEMAPGEGGQPTFLANHAGGILGGIATGQPIRVRVAFKPTSSISSPLRSIGPDGEAGLAATRGRHDPCVAIRAVPVVEAMMALVLADQKLLDRAQCGNRP